MGPAELAQAAPPAPVQAQPPTAAAPAKGPEASPAMRAYFESLHAEAMRAYAIAKQARRKGRDPTTEVEIPPAEDLAARVEAQVGPPGVAERIREATLRLGNREVVSLQVAQDVADEMSRGGASREKALDQSVRTGLSILTEGVLVAPLEGIAEVKIGANADGSDYVDLYFAGPIRAAGGTAQAMSVLIADLVRRRLGIGRFEVTDGEVERYKEEIAGYKVEAHLQYNPSPAEIELIARNCPVCINGEGTEQEEVTGNRDLPRVETNQLRGGACLVMAEGMILKAPKVMKHVEKLQLEGWDFLNQFLKKGLKDEDAPVGADGIPEVPPNNKYVKEIIAGRPVFSHPSRPGGFRLRYGRARTAGLASNAFHPATMAMLDDFLAVGTQLKVERPGKGTVATPCDTIEGPTVLLHNGSLVRVRTVEEARELRPAVREIVDVGEILIPFGEFAENNASLPRSSWVWEWWAQEHAKAGGVPDAHPTGTLSGAEMVRLAESTGVPLHPDGTLLWHDVTAVEMRDLGAWALRNGYVEGGTLWLPAEPAMKETLVKLLALHRAEGARIAVEEALALPLLRGLGLDIGEADADGGRPVADTERRRILFDPCQPDLPPRYPTVELASRLSGFKVMPRAPFRVGGRMGRPEKADSRRMAPPPHGLFPLGGAGGLQRLVRDAAATGTIQVEVGERRCQACGRKGWRTFCDCGGHTDALTRPPRQKGAAFQERETTGIDLRTELDRARLALQLDRLPETVKGVQGVINADKVPEPLEKALLRARNGIYVFKDGTVRFDMTDVPLTHFRPREIGAPVARLAELGYTHDMDGAPLERDDQVLELRVQDIVVADACGDYLLKTAKYMDELLVRFYGLKPYYNLGHRRDLIGHLAIGLAPHTSGGVLCRIIGFTKAQCHFGHPYFHAAKRRNCLHPLTRIHLRRKQQDTVITIEELFASASSEAEEILDDGSIVRRLSDAEVPSLSPDLLQCDAKPIVSVRKVPSPDHLLRLVTEEDQEILCSAGHRMEVVRHGRLVKIEAHAVQVGDFVPSVAMYQGRPFQTKECILVKEHVESATAWLYDVEVADYHNLTLANGVVTSNCDGDEDAVLLLLYGLVNFSRKYVPDKRGGLMDLPLVLSTRLDPHEVDKEAHSVDTLRRYPLEFYEATCRHAPAKEVAKRMGLVESRIGKPEQYEGFGFTHDTADINAGPAASSYKTLGSMMDKMTAQMELARKIRAVDEADVGAR
ncbi:MAG: DNA polymerase II large subunit, partial [Halobacteriales archaeon]|nr:DNA polymerase II large subunit [Halobacteriales archaeon]